MASAGERAYNGGWGGACSGPGVGAPSGGPEGRAVGGGLRGGGGQSPPAADEILLLEHTFFCTLPMDVAPVVAI